MDPAILEAGKKILAEHYAAKLTAEGQPTKPSDVAGRTQCVVNSSDFVKFELETEVLKLYGDIDEKGLFKQLKWFDEKGIKYVWGKVESVLYLLTAKYLMPSREK